MKLDDLKRRRATLEALRLDLPRWTLGEPVDPENGAPLPVVAVDWSEIYCYIMYEPPREEDRGDLFAAHYAGLNYLFFNLRCLPVLLPPYAAEMKSFVEMIQTRTIAPATNADLDQFGDKYGDLLREISRLQSDYPAFSNLIGGNWAATDDLPDQAWEFLETLLKEYIPSVYLNLQETTLNALESLRALLNKTDSGHKRVSSLPALNILAEAACERSLRGWRDWNAEMDSQRPRLERQNQADAMALAYLQALHQASFWKSVPVYFASRSLSMLQVMENHAGEFEPYRRSEMEATRTIHSSWRSWDYFAELGYYSKGFPPSGDGNWQSRSAEIEQDLIKRTAKIDQHIALASRGSTEDIADSFSDWETLRGSFDLDGMGEQKHWQQIRNKRPRTGRRIDLVRFVLSANDSGAFLEKRGALATKILTEIESILGSLPPDAISWAQDSVQPDEDATAILTEIVKEHLDVSGLFEGYLATAASADDQDLIRSVVVLLRALTRSHDQNDRMQRARDLLQLMAQHTNSGRLSQPPRDWLIGIAFFFRALYEESLSYLPCWLEAQSCTPSPGLGLATRALCADAYRLRREPDQGMRLLLDMPQEQVAAMTEPETIVWHCLKGRQLLEWLEDCKENFQIFPKLGVRGLETEVLVPMVSPAAAFLASTDRAFHNLRLRIADIVLRLAGRYIPENVPDLAPQGRQLKLAWLRERKADFEYIENWFRREMETERSAHGLHTLGYYKVKMALVYPEFRNWNSALRLLDEARTFAENMRDTRTERLIAEHLNWAVNTVGAGSS